MEETFYCVRCGRNITAYCIELKYKIRCLCGALYLTGYGNPNSTANTIRPTIENLQALKILNGKEIK